MTIIITKDDKFVKLLRDNLRNIYQSRKRKPDEKIHVSDILPGSCLRKAYFARMTDDYILTDDDVDNFVRGEASEHALVNLANLGVSQFELFFENDLVARPDLMTSNSVQTMNQNNKTSVKDTLSSEIIVEFKDTKSMTRLTPESPRFRSYLRQLLYYLIISNFDTGILCIRYANNRNLKWIKSDSSGDYYFSPRVDKQNSDAKLPDIETWTVIIEKASPIRDSLKDEIRSRVGLLKSALMENSVDKLPKVSEEWKCTKCPFLTECNPNNVSNKDSKKDLLDQNGFITVLPT